MLLKMPGINSKNVGIIMNKVTSFGELVTLSVTELTDILLSEANAQRLHSFLHRKHTEVTDSKSLPGSSRTTASKMLATAASYGRCAKRKKE